MKKILPIVFFSALTNVYAQLPDDALRTAWFTQNGTARNIAIGGVMGSLGGEISANHINPAGLGLYKTRELVLSPGFSLHNNKLQYRGTDTISNKNNFNYGIFGIVLGTGRKENSSLLAGSAFAISINNIANYNNRIQFNGKNNVSSFSEQYLEELTKDRADTNAALSNYIFGSSLAFRTWLVDTIRGSSGDVAGYQSLVPISTGTHQHYDAITSGGYHEIALGLAGNIEDKLYAGGSLILPIISYKRTLSYKENDITDNVNNQFSYFRYTEKFSSSGLGIGAKLGFIYKPVEQWRLGFAFHTPQWLSFTDEISASLTTHTEAFKGTLSETSDNLNSGNPGRRQYNLLTPWRALVSASYVFREIVDTRRQRAFISADLEFVNYRGARFSAEDNEDIALTGYHNMINNTIKNVYKPNINFRLGGELKLHTIMFRLGGAYYGSPYKDDAIKASRILATGGLGYRNYGFFIDLAYSHTFIKDAQFAYRLNDKPNSFAAQGGNRENIMLTVGFKW